MMSIKLSQGYEALVDDEDFERVNSFKWTADVRVLNATGKKYIIARRSTYNGKIRTSMGMQHFVLGIMPWELNGNHLDHEDRNALNNQKYNLRVLSPSENACNSERIMKASHVHYDSNRGKYMVMIKHKYIGRYDTKLEAIAVAESFNCV